MITPPPDVQTVMSAVMVVLNKDPTWSTAKKELGDPQFIKKVMDYDKDNIPPAIIKKIEKYTKQDRFKPDICQKANVAAGALCQWVIAIEDYSKALKMVAPKRLRLKNA